MDKTIEFLWNASQLMAGTIGNTKLHSNYLYKCKELEENGDFSVPNKLFSDQILCKHCFNVWKYGNLSMRILPQQKTGKKMAKLICKRASNKPLSKCESSLLEMYDKKCSNKLSLLCLLCHKKTVLSIRKMPTTTHLKTSIVEDHVDGSISSRKKKKKKKKDPFAGLNKSVCTPLSAKLKISKQKTSSSSKLGSDSNESVTFLKTSSGSLKSGNTKTPNSSTSTPLNSFATSKPRKSRGLQKVLFQGTKNSKANSLQKFLENL